MASRDKPSTSIADCQYFSLCIEDISTSFMVQYTHTDVCSESGSESGSPTSMQSGENTLPTSGESFLLSNTIRTQLVTVTH